MIAPESSETEHHAARLPDGADERSGCGSGVAFHTATDWATRLADAQRQGRLDDELARLQRLPLLIVDEVGYG